MLILLVSDNFVPNMDGVVVSLENTINSLIKKGHKIILFAPKYDKGNFYKKKHLKVFRFRSIPFTPYPNYRICLPNVLDLRRIIKNTKPDIIHIHTFPGILAVLSLVLAKLEKIPVITTYHASYPDVLVYLSPSKVLKFDRFFKKILKSEKETLRYSLFQEINKFIKKLEKPVILAKFKINEKSDLITIGKEYTHRISKKTVFSLTNLYFNRADLIIAPSKPIEKELRKYKAKKTIRVVSNGINTKVFKLKKTYSSKMPKFLHVGRLGFEKKIELLLRAMSIVAKKFPSAKLTIIGDGPAKEKLLRMTQDLKLENNIKFLGFRERVLLPNLYRKHDVFITASEMETQGLVILEAMSSGLAVIGVNVLAVPDLVSNGKNGYVVKKGNFKLLADRMIRFIKYPNMIEYMGKNSRKSAVKHDISYTMNELENCYKDLIKK